MNTKINEVERKIPDANGLVTTNVFNTKLRVESKVFDHTIYVITLKFINLMAQYLTQN